MILKLDKLRCLACFLLLIPVVSLAQVQNHIVRRGDTLYSIGRMYGMTVREIQELNSLESTNLSIGQSLKVKAEPQANAAPVPAPPLVPSPSPTPVAPPIQRSEEASAEPLRQVQRSSLPDNYFYQIQRGDNLFRIAKNHNIGLPDLLLWNGFANADVAIYPGQRVVVRDPFTAPATERTVAETPAVTRDLDIPVISAAPPDTVMIEKVYVVQPKDTLFKIARENNMSVDELKRLNSLSSNDIRVGQRIYLAGSPRPAGSASSSANITQEELLKRDKLRDDLVLPVEGNILSEYGLRNGRPHKGIDIGAKSGTPIYAVLEGTVVYSGVQGAYGNVVVLEHPDFVMTVYAHNEKNLVAVGDKVQKGQQIATVGSTGNATGSHLHFEYRIKGKAINPRKVLPL